jgi:hypothetical protein
MSDVCGEPPEGQRHEPSAEPGAAAEPEATRAVVDRVVDGVALLLVGTAEREVERPVGELPDGTGEGSWLLVRAGDGDVEIVGVDETGSAARRAEVSERLDRIRGSRGSGRFPPRA